jgi:hypothetical protein
MFQEDDDEQVQQEEQQKQENLNRDGNRPSSKLDSISGSRFFSVYEISPSGKKEKKGKGKQK